MKPIFCLQGMDLVQLWNGTMLIILFHSYQQPIRNSTRISLGGRHLILIFAMQRMAVGGANLPRRAHDL